ncbi:MAG: hypothetical protein ABI679_13985, partial [Gemmatimonadota bacterium]
ARVISPAGLPLALARSHRAAFTALGQVIWPRHPTPRWQDISQLPSGRWMWRLKRLVRMGRS